MKIVLQLFILFTIPALALSCNQHTTSNTVQIDQSEAAEIVLDEPQSELCRVVVNYKNNRHHYVEFGKNGFKPIDAQGTLVKLDDEWGIISIAKFQFADQRITSNEFILRMMNANSDLLYQIRRPMRILDNGYYGYKTWNHFCLPYAYHEAFDGFLIYKPKHIGYFTELSLNDNPYLDYSRELFYKRFKSIKDRKIALCEMKYDWMVYNERLPLYYICEAIQFDRYLNIYETFSDYVTIYIKTKATTCQGDSLDENFSSIRIRSNPDEDYIFTINSFIRALIPNDVSDNYKETQDISAPLSLVLFTEGKRQRRSFGVPLDWKDGKVTQIAELSETPEVLEDILQSIDKAPNGCGSFDWETAELVHKDGKRYSLGAFASIAGIYWLSPDDELDWSALSSKAEPLVFNDYEYEPPQPMPNCEYFSEAHQAKLKYDERARECGCRLSFTELYHISEKCTTEVYDYFFEHYDDFVDEIEEAEGPNEDLDCGGGS